MAINQLLAKPGDAICQTHSDVHVVLSHPPVSTVIFVARSRTTRMRLRRATSYKAVLRSAACLLTRPAFAAPGAAKAENSVDT